MKSLMNGNKEKQFDHDGKSREWSDLSYCS